MRDDTALKAHANGELRSDSCELFMAALSILSIVNLAILHLVDDQSMSYVLGTINLILTVIFLLHFLVWMKSARSKSTYLFREFGWPDLLAVAIAKDRDGVRPLRRWTQITSAQEPR